LYNNTIKKQWLMGSQFREMATPFGVWCLDKIVERTGLGLARTLTHSGPFRGVRLGDLRFLRTRLFAWLFGMFAYLINRSSIDSPAFAQLSQEPLNIGLQNSKCLELSARVKNMRMPSVILEMPEPIKHQVYKSLI
jgi:hypothetical protein